MEKRFFFLAFAAAAAFSAPALSVAIEESDCECENAAFFDLKLDKSGMDGIEARALAFCAPEAHHGTPALVFEFANRTAFERSFHVSASLDMTCSSSKSFSVQPGGTARFTLFLPLAFEFGGNAARMNGIVVTETTPHVKWRMQPCYPGLPRECHFDSFSYSDPSLFLSAGISADTLRKSLTAAMRSRKYSPKHQNGITYKYRYRQSNEKNEKPPYGFSASLFAGKPADWPRDWRCYSTYDAVLATRREYDELPAEAKDALEIYRMLGGAVIAVEGEGTFENEASAVLALKEIDRSADALAGDLNLARGYYGKYASASFSEELKRIPIEAKSTIPVKSLILILAVFSLLIVPLAVFCSVKRNSRMKLLAILPGAAALFAAAIAAFAYWFFGTTPSVRLQSVTILDQTSKKALTRGQFAIFSPVSLKDGLSFPEDSTFRMRSVRGDGGSLDPRMESAGEFRLGGSWITPLVTTFFDFERASPRPERLDFRASPAGVTVVNLLGAKVAWGVANVGGALWEFRDVPPGGEVQAERPLAVVKKPSATKEYHPFGGSTSHGRDWKACMAHAREAICDIPPGSYIAEVDGSPFFPNPVRKTDANASEAGLVYGKFAEAAE